MLFYIRSKTSCKIPEQRKNTDSYYNLHKQLYYGVKVIQITFHSPFSDISESQKSFIFQNQLREWNSDAKTSGVSQIVSIKKCNEPIPYNM